MIHGRGGGGEEVRGGLKAVPWRIVLEPVRGIIPPVKCLWGVSARMDCRTEYQLNYVLGGVTHPETEWRPRASSETGTGAQA